MWSVTNKYFQQSLTQTYEILKPVQGHFNFFFFFFLMNPLIIIINSDANHRPCHTLLLPSTSNYCASLSFFHTMSLSKSSYISKRGGCSNTKATVPKGQWSEYRAGGRKTKEGWEEKKQQNMSLQLCSLDLENLKPNRKLYSSSSTTLSCYGWLLHYKRKLHILQWTFLSISPTSSIITASSSVLPFVSFQSLSSTPVSVFIVLIVVGEKDE